MEKAPTINQAATLAKKRLNVDWGIPAKNLQESLVMTKDVLRQYLEIGNHQTKESDYRFVPDTFDENDSDVHAFSVLKTQKLRGLDEKIKSSHSESSIMVHTPLFWQMEPFVYNVRKNLKAPVFVVQPQNLPVASAAILDVGINIIISDPKNAAALSLYLLEKNIPHPDLWLIIHPCEKTDWDTPITLIEEKVDLRQSVHLVPGVALLEQCNFLSAKKEPWFHAVDSFLWEIEKDKTSISTITDGIFPLFLFPLPFLLEDTGICWCGKNIVTKKNVGI